MSQQPWVDNVASSPPTAVSFGTDDANPASTGTTDGTATGADTDIVNATVHESDHQDASDSVLTWDTIQAAVHGRVSGGDGTDSRRHGDWSVGLESLFADLRGRAGVRAWRAWRAEKARLDTAEAAGDISGSLQQVNILLFAVVLLGLIFAAWRTCVDALLTAPRAATGTASALQLVGFILQFVVLGWTAVVGAAAWAYKFGFPLHRRWSAARAASAARRNPPLGDQEDDGDDTFSQP
jgi:hypothetical protein